MKCSNLFTRIQSLILALAMVISLINPLLTLNVFAEGGENATKTEGQIVAENYDLTKVQAAFVSNPGVIGGEISYSVPNESDDLISVDTETKTISAETHKSGSYTWIPVKAELYVDEELEETVVLAGTPAKGVYEYGGDAFSIKVLYEVAADISTELQKTILEAPSALKAGIANFDDINAIDSKLYTIMLAMDVLEKLASEEGYQVYVPAFSNYIRLGFNPEGDAVDAVGALADQIADNQDGKTDLEVVALEYSLAKADGLGLAYAYENASDVRALLEETYSYVYAIRNDIGKGGKEGETNIWNTITTWGAGSEGIDLVIKLRDTMDSWLDSAKAILDADWRIAEDQYLDDNLSDIEYKVLSNALALVTEDVEIPAILKNTLLVDSTYINFNMSMSDVTVKVIIMVADGKVNSAELVEGGYVSDKFTLADGATKQDILDKVDNIKIVDKALAEWDFYDEDKYSVSYGALPEVLGEDITYTITYTPNNYTIYTNYDGELSVPYGYRYEFPEHADREKAYDYYIGDVYYEQGADIVIVDDISVRREEGKAYVPSNTINVVVNNILKGDEKATAIIMSGAFNADALKEDEPVNVRYPEPGVDTLVSISDGVITARSYPSGYKNLYWMPYSYKIHTEQAVYTRSGASNKEGLFNGKLTVTIPDEYKDTYSKIDVVYRLELVNVGDEDVSYLANLPKTLEDEANGQKGALDSLYSLKDKLDALNMSVLSSMNGEIEALEGVSPEVKNDLMDTLSGILEGCYAPNRALKLSNTLAEYEKFNDGGKLEYYYRNYEQIQEEVNALATHLSDLLGSQEKQQAITLLLEKLSSPVTGDLTKYSGMLEDIKAKVNGVAAALTDPNEVIDTNSSRLGYLTSALTAGGNAGTYGGEAIKTLYLESEAFAIVASDKKMVEVKVSVEGDSKKTAYSKAFREGYVLTDVDVQDMIDTVKAFVETLGVSDYFYVSNLNYDDLKALNGTEIENRNITREYEWTLRELTVYVEGMDPQYITLDDRIINLEVSGDPSERYDYTIDGKVVNGVNSYSFGKTQLERLFGDDYAYSIDREEIDVEREDLQKFVNSLNAAANSDAIVFALFEDSGSYSIVMKLDAANYNALMSVMPSVIMALTQTDYIHIQMGGEDFVNKEGGVSVSLQAVVDALMNSGFGTDTLVSLIDKNGKINNNVYLDGDVISNKEIGALGGLLFKTDLSLLDIEYIGKTLPIYITASSVPSQLTRVRNFIAGDAGNYFSMICEDDKANVTLNMPGKAYEAYLAALLVTDQLEITDLEAIDAEIAVGFVKDLIDPVLSGEVSAKTLSNTLSKLGYKLDVTKYSKVFDMLCDVYADMTFTYDEDTAMASGKIEIKELVDSFGLGALANMIAEYNTGIEFDIALSVENLGVEYEALYVDVKADGYLNKVGLTKDVASKAAGLAGTSVIVLLKDIDGDLVISEKVVLDLNGFTVNGKLVSKGNVIVINTPAAPDAYGTVTDGISGNVTVAGGKYSYDVSGFVKEGYVQKDNGVVANNFYNIINDDETITIELDAGVLAIEEKPAIETLLVNIAADLLMNGYTANKLAVEGNLVYEIALEDIVGLYTGSNKLHAGVESLTKMFDSKELANIINMLVADLTDFSALAENIENDKPILSYDITVGAWTVALEHVTEGNYLTANLTSGNGKDKTLEVVIVGAEEAKADLVGMAKEFAKTVDVELEVVGDQYFDSKNDKNFVLDWTVTKGVVEIDLSKDGKYAVAMAILFADGLGGTVRDNLVKAVKDYYREGSTAHIEKIVEGLTVQQIIKAVENFQRTDDFSAMIAKLGLTDVVGDDVVGLEACFDNTVKLAAALVRKLDIDRGNVKLGSFFDKNNVAELVRENVSRTKTIKLVKGYTLTLDLDADLVRVYVKLFGETAPLNYDEYNAILKEVAGLDEDDYTEGSWSDLQTALDEAAEMVEAAIFQSDIDKAVKLIRNAINALVEMPDETEPDETEPDETEPDETEPDETEPDETEPDETEPEEPALDYVMLDALIAQVEALKAKENDYTASSWANLMAALANAKAVRQSATIQKEIDAAYTSLYAAKDALKKKVDPSGDVTVKLDYTELDEQIAIAKALNEADYTEESWSKLEAALAAAEATRANAISQLEIDVKVVALKNAIAALVRVPDETEPAGPDETEPAGPDETEPDDPDETEPKDPDETEPVEPKDNKVSPLVWIVPSVVVASGAAAGTYVFIRRRRLTDKTPLVDYSADDDI